MFGWGCVDVMLCGGCVLYVVFAMSMFVSFFLVCKQPTQPPNKVFCVVISCVVCIMSTYVVCVTYISYVGGV